VTIIWIIGGAVVGFALSAAFDSGAGGLLGAVLGWVMSRGGDSGERIAALERRLEGLETSLSRLAARAAGATPAASTVAPPPVPESPVAPVPAPVEQLAELRAAEPTARAAEPEPTPAAPSAPAEPDAFERAFAAAREWFLSGNVPVKVGIIVSFFGVAFLLKFAVDEGWLSAPIELRLAGVAAGALAMLVFGWRVRERNRVFALSIQGGGVGVLYLTVFAAFNQWHLMPAGLAFAFLILLTLAGSVLAVLQRAQALAVFAAVGGFLAPVLVSTGSGDHVALFSYYLLLNTAILGIAWYMAWRPLNWVGFVATFVIGIAWGIPEYRADKFLSTEPFLIAFFLQYLVVSILFAIRHGTRGYVDGTLVFGLPLVSFALQARLVEPYEDALAGSAVVLGLLYAALATWLVRSQRDNARLLTESFMVLAVGFGTIAIPLALDAQWTSAAFALEGAGLLWVGLRQGRLRAELAGTALIGLAGVRFLAGLGEIGVEPMLFNGRTLGGTLIALAALTGAALIQRRGDPRAELHPLMSLGLVVWGLLWWFGTGAAEITRQTAEALEPAAMVAFAAASALLFDHAAARSGATRLAVGAGVLPVLLLVFSAAWLDDKSHPAADYGWLAWPAALATLWLVARRMERLNASYALGCLHVAAWLAIFHLAWEAHWALGEVSPYTVWDEAGALAVIALAATLLATRSTGSLGALSGWGAGVPVVVGLAFAAFLQLKDPGAAHPLPYMPLLNPLDIATFLALGAALLWNRASASKVGLVGHDGGLRVLLAGAVFVIATMTTLRTVHHWTGVPFDGDALFDSAVVQTALALVWSTLGVTAMLLGAQRANRRLWMGGAALMAIVVLKLFTIDLGNSGTVGRIVAFIGVGVLLMAIGWYAPLPARAAEDSR
jgi:uncharacterized membrane protein